jgi:hypothetical protein
MGPVEGGGSGGGKLARASCTAVAARAASMSRAPVILPQTHITVNAIRVVPVIHIVVADEKL